MIWGCVVSLGSICLFVISYLASCDGGSEKGRAGGGGRAVTTPLPNESFPYVRLPHLARSPSRRRGAGASCAAQTPPPRTEMKKLAVGAENWSIDTFAPSVDLGIASSGLFLPRPQMGCARIAEGWRTPRPAAGRNRRSSPFPAFGCPTYTFVTFYPTPDFFFFSRSLSLQVRTARAGSS